MPNSLLPTETKQPRADDAAETGAAAPSDKEAPLSFVPHVQNGAAPVRIRTGRYGELEEHELLHLLDSIEDERAKARFRESVYLSVFVWMVVAWVVLYGPRYLWHAPKLINPADVLREREMVQLNAPKLPSSVRPPGARPAPKALDNKTLEKLRTMTPKPAPPTAQPLPSAPAPNVPQPVAPTPVPVRPAPPVADAPLPQAPTKPNFDTSHSVGDAIQQAIRDAARGGTGGGAVINGGGGRGATTGTGVDILSDTQGVNFNPYLQRILRQIYEQWLPLIPEEARPPLSKQGVTQIRFSIGPDGTVLAMHLDGSTHDDALNRAAWGSINGQQFPPLPSQFHGPQLELRIHYLVNKTTE